MEVKLIQGSKYLSLTKGLALYRSYLYYFCKSLLPYIVIQITIYGNIGSGVMSLNLYYHIL